MTININTDLTALVSAAATAVYAAISALSLWLLSRQIRDARRFGAAPALYALLKELEEHMSAVRQLGNRNTDDAEARETISRYLEFFERVEHLRSAGVLPATVLRRAFGPALVAHLADPRFERVIQQDARQYEEVLLLAKRIGHR
jgi:hypothetical protein